MTYPTYRLDSGDRVRIIVFGQDNLSRLYSVDTAGRIAFPLIGTDEARGLSRTQLGSKIEGKLRKNYIKDLKVRVEVDACRPFTFSARSKPGQYPYVNGQAQLPSPKAIPCQTANGQVDPQIRWHDEHVMVPTDYPVRPGVTIYVLERFF